jgi:hypothetical protein
MNMTGGRWRMIRGRMKPKSEQEGRARGHAAGRCRPIRRNGLSSHDGWVVSSVSRDVGSLGRWCV